MLDWMLELFRDLAARFRLTDTPNSDADTINRFGGSDRFCLWYVNYFHSDRERMKRLRAGVMRREEYPAPQSTVSLAAINSMMKARQELVDERDGALRRRRLKIAEEAFLLSWLQFHEKDLDRFKQKQKATAIDQSMRELFSALDPLKTYSGYLHRKFADERLKKGRDALESWRKRDPFNFQFTTDIN